MTEEIPVHKTFNIRGGKHYKKAKSGRVKINKQCAKIDIENKQGYYATVVKMLGTNKVAVRNNENKQEYTVIIPGKLYNRGGAKNRIKIDSQVLISGQPDINIMGEIVSVIRPSDSTYAEATQNNKHSYDNDSDEDSYDIDEENKAMYKAIVNSKVQQKLPTNCEDDQNIENSDTEINIDEI
jgi:translation initiation factor IF-1